MSNKMLIDATHPEETRVVVLRGNRVEEFDFEAADRQQLRGNIYLAKVTRVEPSLQAAFVDYGGNRHGFLAFSEIHPDYYQIPYADRQALLQEQAREAAEDAAAETAAGDAAASIAGDAAAPDQGEAAPRPAETAEAWPDQSDATAPASDGSEAAAEPVDSEGESPDATARSDPDSLQETEHDEPETVESVGAEDALEEVPERRKPRPRQYKIQEVIKRRQVMLVQVVKEERGNKGAALTTYLSLAGRYSVLMPNTGRGGGISRKITNAADRKRLKEIAAELDVPEGMGVILRTAGANRTKAEVKRDFEYLLRLWENVRELTLRSTAPKLVYEEGNLIKRSIRDLYSREIDQIIVAGEDAYREAKDFMRMLMPSHARNVQVYKDETPLFARSGVEAQLDAMFSPQVTLRSGGYIVINQTEALVSIDVNSGRATREHSIEDTALNTNLEAAEEIARQLRLRDLAGLIVIDFIDMEEKRNNRAVERKLKDCLRADRARIQLGRISHFGLMEMSRQRIRTGVLESSTVPCPHCRGTGQVRSIASLTLQILRALEDYLLRHSGHHLLVRTRPEVALYILNQKRRHLAQLEERFGLGIMVSGEAPENGSGFVLERGEPVSERPARVAPISMAETPPPEEIEAESDEREPDEEQRPGEQRSRSSRRRRRRRGNGEDRYDLSGAPAEERGHEAEEEEAFSGAAEAADEASGEAESRPESEGEPGQGSGRRRRGRRGGRRRSRSRDGAESFQSADERQAPSEPEFAPADASDQEAAMIASGEERGPRGDVVADHVYGGDADESPDGEREYGGRESIADAAPDASETAAEAAPDELVFEPEASQARDSAPEPVVQPEPVEDDRPKRSGWWSRRSSFF
jgi:ribonuclease E